MGFTSLAPRRLLFCQKDAQGKESERERKPRNLETSAAFLFSRSKFWKLWWRD